MMLEPEPYGLRFLREPDIATLTRWEEERPYPWTCGHFEETLSSQTTRTLVLEKENEMMGFAVAQIISEEAYLLNMMVAPGQKRLGYGQEILERTFNWAKACGAAHLFLDVDATNTPAIGLYKKLGFQPLLERRKGSYPRGEEAILMRRDL